MTPQKLVDAMIMIAEAAVSEHTNRNSDYCGMSMNRAKEDAIKLLSDECDSGEAIMILEHQISELTQANRNLTTRIGELVGANSTLKQRCLALEVENEQIKKDYCGF